MQAFDFAQASRNARPLRLRLFPSLSRHYPVAAGRLKGSLHGNNFQRRASSLRSIARKFFPFRRQQQPPLTRPAALGARDRRERKNMHITEAVTILESLAALLTAGATEEAMQTLEAALHIARRQESDYEAWLALNMLEGIEADETGLAW